jgi:hypothetical protein
MIWFCCALGFLSRQVYAHCFRLSLDSQPAWPASFSSTILNFPFLLSTPDPVLLFSVLALGFSSVSSLLRQGSARSVFLLPLSVTRLRTGQGHRIRPGLRFGWISSTLIFVRHLFMFHLPASPCSPPVCKRCHPFYCCSFWPPSVGAGQASALDHLCSLLCVGIVAPDQITLPR